MLRKTVPNERFFANYHVRRFLRPAIGSSDRAALQDFNANPDTTLRPQPDEWKAAFVIAVRDGRTDVLALVQEVSQQLNSVNLFVTELLQGKLSYLVTSIHLETIKFFLTNERHSLHQEHLKHLLLVSLRGVDAQRVRYLFPLIKQTPKLHQEIIFNTLNGLSSTATIPVLKTVLEIMPDNPKIRRSWQTQLAKLTDVQKEMFNPVFQHFYLLKEGQKVLKFTSPALKKSRPRL